MAGASPVQAHPLAGVKGEGPPVAPPNWKWRCGNRIRDMYFYAPDGKQFRSRIELATFLGKLPNGPSPTEFCWKVTPDVLSSGTWKKEEQEERPKKSPGSKSTPGSKKRRNSGNLEAADSTRSAEVDRKSNTEDGEMQLPEVELRAVRASGTVASKKVTPPSARSRARARKKATSETEVEEAHPSFKEILQENSSFMWLRNENTMKAFLQEANRLDEAPASYVREMRDALVARNLQNTNLTKYPNSILRIFARILGVDGLGEEPSDSLGKVELAALCVKLARTQA